jgi:hypothetical protein
LAVDGRPVAIGLFENHPLDPNSYDSNGKYIPGAGHQVLAYAIDKTKGELFIYDPNYPGDNNQKIEYDTTNESFKPRLFDLSIFPWRNRYYSWFHLEESNIREPFENILEDAEEGFTGDNRAHISILSHTNGQTVNTRTVTFAGHIGSSDALITDLYVWVSGDNAASTTLFTTKVNIDGNFVMTVNLSEGENRFSFETIGGALEGSGVWWPALFNPSTPNNLPADSFSLTLVTTDPAVMQVTLTWDKPDTDVDLYVIDPTGDASWFQHKTTADGGELDVDDTDGYGPEHWTLTLNDTVRWGEPYKVRVHYFGGSVGTNFTVKLRLYEGTSLESERVIMSGYLTHGGSGSSPDASGEGWWQDYEVVLDPSIYRG